MISSCAASIPCNIYSMLSAWAIVENFKFIEMRMSIELSSNDHVESINDSAIFSRPPFEATSATRWNVLENVNSFICSLSSQECVVKPLHGRLNLSSTVHHPPVVDVAIIIVQCNQTETRSNERRVISCSSNSGDFISRNPSMTTPCVC
jgi:hypothetical protein